MRCSKVALIIAVLLAGTSVKATAEPVLSLGSLSAGQGETVGLNLSLSNNTQAIGGINAKIVLPDGVTCTGASPGALAPGDFVLTYEPHPSGQNDAVTVFGYSRTTPITAASGVLLTLTLSVSPTAPMGTYGLAFASSNLIATINANHALSNALGTVSLAHSTTNGTISVVDTTPPTVTLASTAPDPTNVSPIPVTVTFSEPVADFGAGDIVPTNGAINNFTGSGTAYSFDLIPGSQGTVTVAVGPGVAHDGAGNGNTAATPLSRLYDSARPTVSMTSAALDPTSLSPIPVTVTFSKPVTGFVQGDIVPTNATVSGFGGSGATYSFNLTPGGQGAVAADIAENVAQDGVGNLNQPGTFSRTYDSIPPTASITLDDPTPTGADVVHFSVDFTENVGASFDASDVTITGTVPGAKVVSGTDPNYTVTVTTTDPNANGTVGIAVGAGVTDLAGNPYVGGSSLSYTLANWIGFTTQPSGSMKYTGDSHTFEVAIPPGPLTATYQWKWDDGTKTLHIGPTTATWSLPVVTPVNQGDYWCEVTYNGVVHTSDHVTLKVDDHLEITQQPQGGDKHTGDSHTFSVLAAGGYAPRHFRWMKDGSDIPDATGASYEIPLLSESDGGVYTVEVSDGNTDVRVSDPASLTVTLNLPVAELAGLGVLFGLITIGAVRKMRRIRNAQK